MRRVILFTAASVDGFIADLAGSVAFLEETTRNSQAGGYSKHTDKPLDSFGPPGFTTIVWGRKTFEHSCDLIKAQSQGVRSFPFVKTTEGVPIRNIILSRNAAYSLSNLLDTVPGLADARLEILRIEDENTEALFSSALTGDVWLMGGAEVNGLFIKHVLIDELMVTIHPTLLIAGIPLIRPLSNHQSSEHPVRLELLNHRVLPDGMVFLHYKLYK